MSSQISDQLWVSLGNDGNIYPYQLGLTEFSNSLAEGFTIDNPGRISYKFLLLDLLEKKKKKDKKMRPFSKNGSDFSIQPRDKTDVFYIV